MLEILTGRNYLLGPALLEGARSALARPEGTLFVVVPKQLTLQTELDLIGGLGLKGSFRLQVLSPERLCGRIFDAAGRMEGLRVDDRGRVMLARAAAKLAREELTLYRGAEQRRGFSQRAARQLELVRQAGLTPEDLDRMAEGQTGVMAHKLRDLARLLEAYQRLIEGRFQDGEAEFAAASARAGEARFLGESQVWFYGFDLMPPPLHGLIAAVAGVCPEVRVLLPLENDPEARDAEVYLPVRHSCERLTALAREAGVEVRRTPLSAAGPERHPELAHLERELYAFPASPWGEGAPRAIQLAARRDPGDEARFVAALARRLAQKRGMRWNDMLVLCPDLDTYARPLSEAFRAYGVPLFVSSSRPASRHALAECLLTALAAVSGNYRPEDMLTLMRTGYMQITEDEADRLANYAVQYGLKGAAFLKPLTRGPESLREALEPVRARLTQPLVRLREGLREAGSLRDQLRAVFGFLTDIFAYEKSLERQKALQEASMRQLAGEEGQVWTRVLGALDQMDALMGEKKLARKELAELLRESLDAAVIKPLPQSGDAVSAQPLDRIAARSARAVFFVGMTDRAAGGDEGLLSDAQRGLLAQLSGRYVGLSAMDEARTRRFYVKTALGMARDYACFSYPLSGADAGAERPSPVIGSVRELFPGLEERGGVTGDQSMEQMLRGARQAALDLLGPALTAREGDRGADAEALAALSALPEAREELKTLRSALDRGKAADSLDPRTARRLYGAIQKASVTRLERFAACPFSHYVEYGLNPERVEPYQLTPKDEGTFYHDAVRAFLSRHWNDLADMSEGQAEAAMDELTSRLLEELALGPLGENAVTRAESRRLRDTMRTAAKALRAHLAGSGFTPSALEVKFGPGDGDARLLIDCEGGPVTLEGRIDRVDVSAGPGARYVRVIDYKRGSRAPEAGELFQGSQLQLPVYLGAAMRVEGALSAGAYYFRVDEALVTSASSDPEVVEAERMEKLRMSGILPTDPELLERLAADPQKVLAGVSVKGTPRPSALAADQAGFERIVDHALLRARQHVEGIRAGRAEASPLRTRRFDPCAWCSWRGACLRDETLDARKTRKVEKMKPEEMMAALERAEGE